MKRHQFNSNFLPSSDSNSKERLKKNKNNYRVSLKMRNIDSFFNELYILTVLSSTMSVVLDNISYENAINYIQIYLPAAHRFRHNFHRELNKIKEKCQKRKEKTHIAIHDKCLRGKEESRCFYSTIHYYSHSFSLIYDYG